MEYIEFKGIRDFDAKETFTCGQCFRWRQGEDGLFEGIASGRYGKVEYSKGTIKIHGAKEKDRDFWFDYLDLGRDYSAIKKELRKVDDKLSEAIDYAPGIRILNQELFETTISFIISANNNIPRIMKIVESLCTHYGKKTAHGYAFPAPEVLAEASVCDISEFTHAGYRCDYIVKTAKAFTENSLTKEKLKKMTREEARKTLLALPGVGPKVCDCILLFTGIRQDVFPTDVWVKRVMKDLYFGRDASIKEIDEFALKHFGNKCGIAQQYLFMKARG